jgi:hypothetical protein
VSFFDRFRKRPAVTNPPPEPPELSPSPHTPLHVTRCIDHLALIHPLGWQELQIRAHIENAVTLIDSTDVKLAEGAEPTPEFPDDRGLRSALLATAFHDLCASIGLVSDVFCGFNAYVDANSIGLSGLTLVGGGPRLYTPTFFGALALALRGGQEAFHHWQEEFRVPFAERSAGRLHWDRAAGALVLTDAAGKTSTAEAHVLGSYAPGENTWCWAWANPALEDATQTALRRVRDETDLELLRQPGFDCTAPFSFTVAALAAHAIDPHLHVWRWPRNADLFFAVRLG